VVFGWSSLAYRIFYLFGAVLNIAWLGLGTLWLLWYRPAAIAATVALAVISVAAVFIVARAEFVPGAMAALAAKELPSARDVMPPLARGLSRWFSITGSVIVLMGTLISIELKRNALGLGILTLGVVVVGVASEFARAGYVLVFSIGLAAGIALMYGGFVRTRT
jgi:hypothetical protein